MAVADVPEHVRWAVEVLAPRQDERVLDIGSGTGASVELILEEVAATSGPTSAAASASPESTGDAAGIDPAAAVVAIDRSSTAVQRIRQRLSTEVERGTVLVLESDLATLEATTGPFDAALAVNVNVFWTTDAAPELEALAGVLEPGGRVLIAYGTGPGGSAADRDHLDRVEESIAASRAFEVERRIEAEQGSGVLAVCTNVGA
jgi:SAM-dependent methyltransferase